MSILDTGQCAVQPCMYSFSLALCKHILNLYVSDIWLQKHQFRNFMHLFGPLQITALSSKSINNYFLKKVTKEEIIRNLFYNVF